MGGENEESAHWSVDYDGDYGVFWNRLGAWQSARDGQTGIEGRGSLRGIRAAFLERTNRAATAGPAGSGRSLAAGCRQVYDLHDRRRPGLWRADRPQGRVQPLGAEGSERLETGLQQAARPVGNRARRGAGPGFRAAQG